MPRLLDRPELVTPGDLAAQVTQEFCAQMRERCATRRNGERAGSFAVRGAGGIPAEPDGWLPEPLLADLASIAAEPAAPPALVASLPASFLAREACR